MSHIRLLILILILAFSNTGNSQNSISRSDNSKIPSKHIEDVSKKLNDIEQKLDVAQGAINQLKNELNKRLPQGGGSDEELFKSHLQQLNPFFNRLILEQVFKRQGLPVISCTTTTQSSKSFSREQQSVIKLKIGSHDLTKGIINQIFSFFNAKN